MKSQVEQYTKLPESIQLPQGIHTGLKSLWKKSTVTQTEWVGATIRSSGKYRVIPLGHQATKNVTVPVVNLGHNAEESHRKIDENFIHEEWVTSEWDIRHVPNQEGVNYKGAILYLLPRNIIPIYTKLFLSILSPGDKIIPEEEFLGIAHSHPFRDSLSHLPSLHDARHFVFGSLPILFEQVVSDKNVSLLVKSKDATHFQSHPERFGYLNMQELTDKLELEGGHTYLEVLQANCERYKLGLYSGKLNSEEPLNPFFQKTP